MEPLTAVTATLIIERTYSFALVVLRLLSRFGRITQPPVTPKVIDFLVSTGTLGEADVLLEVGPV